MQLSRTRVEFNTLRAWYLMAAITIDDTPSRQALQSRIAYDQFNQDEEVFEIIEDEHAHQDDDENVISREDYGTYSGLVGSRMRMRVLAIVYHA
jgi:BioD-like phosphotransacetylase family protein